MWSLSRWGRTNIRKLSYKYPFHAKSTYLVPNCTNQSAFVSQITNEVSPKNNNTFSFLDDAHQSNHNSINFNNSDGLDKTLVNSNFSLSDIDGGTCIVNPQEDPFQELYRRQIELENGQTVEATDNLIKIVDSLNKMGRGSSLKPVQQILLKWYEPFCAAVTLEMEKVMESESIVDIQCRFLPAVLLVGIEKTVFITLNTIINNVLEGANRGVNVAGLARSIAEQMQEDIHLAKSEDSTKWNKYLKAETFDKKKDLENKKNCKMKAKSIEKLRKKLQFTRQLRKLLDDVDWLIEVKIKLGAFLLHTCINTTMDTTTNSPVFMHETIFNKKIRKKLGTIKMNPSCFIELTEKNNYAAVPRYLPMLVPPRKWNNNYADKKIGTYNMDGGYFQLKTHLLRFRTSSQNAALKYANMEPLLEALNYLGGIPWKINTNVLSVVNDLYARGDCVGELPSQTIIPLPTKQSCFRPRKELIQKYVPKKTKKKKNIASKTESVSVPGIESAIEGIEDAVTDEVIVAEETNKTDMKIDENLDPDELVFDQILYNFLSRKVREKNQANHSLKCDLMIKLNIAENFKNETIYFPWNLDFRGRAYPIPPNLNHLGSDLCRSLLFFAEKKPLGENGLEWLKIHLCNLVGNNKISMSDRVKWADDNMDNITDTALNPIEGKRWWTKTESPFQVLATCIEIHNAVNSPNPAEYLSNLPVHQDGSCNGLQHYAALGRDLDGAKAVNLVNAELPQDVYTKVLHKVLAIIEKDRMIPDDEENVISKYKRKSAQVVYGHIDRKVIKQTVMTSVYGVTHVGARAQILGKLKEKLYGNDSPVLSKEDDQSLYVSADYVARITLTSLADMFSSANAIMEWLAHVSQEVAKQGHVMSWITPLGLPVMQPYRNTLPHSIKTPLQQITLALESDALPVSMGKQKTAFPPNYVHSLDSTHMFLTVLKMKELNIPYTAVHDSYWTYPCHIDVMNQELRNCFVELYDQSLLENLRSSLIRRFPEANFPPLPKRGELDINEVKKSRYFFH